MKTRWKNYLKSTAPEGGRDSLLLLFKTPCK